MAELRKCSRCKSLITLEHYSLNRKGEYFKCCDNCRNKSAEYNREYRPKWDCEIICDHCGDRTTKNCKSIHKRRFWCQTSQMNPRPTFEEWLVEQDYDKLLWEYKQVLKELLDKKKPHPNDDYIIVGGRTYLKGESPLEGVWHCDHTPFEVKYYTIFENGVERGVKITTI